MPATKTSASLIPALSSVATSKKSNATYVGINKALEDVKTKDTGEVPMHIRNAPTKIMKDLGYGKGYDWQAGFNHPEGFLPKEIKNH